MRGAIITSMASRVSTNLHIGTIEPSTSKVLKREFEILLILAMGTSLYAALITSMLTQYSINLEVSIAVLSGILAILFLAPFASYIATFGFRRGLDPDRYMAPVLTVVGDLSTAPTIVGIAVLVEYFNISEEVLLSIILSYISVTAFTAFFLRVPGRRRIVIESMIALLIVGILESVAGFFLVGYSATLIGLGVLHAVPSIMEDVGAAASVASSKLSTLTHLYGVRETLKYLPTTLAEVVLGSMGGFLTLAGIAYLTQGIAGAHASILTIFNIVFWTGVLGTIIFSIIGYLLVGLSVAVKADPDNTVIPLLTSIVDSSVIPLLILLSLAVVR